MVDVQHIRDRLDRLNDKIIDNCKEFYKEEGLEKELTHIDTLLEEAQEIVDKSSEVIDLYDDAEITIGELREKLCEKPLIVEFIEKFENEIPYHSALWIKEELLLRRIS
jgi:hypothetical protein